MEKSVVFGDQVGGLVAGWSFAQLLPTSFSRAVTDRVPAQMVETCFSAGSIVKTNYGQPALPTSILLPKPGMCNLSAHLLNFQKPRNQFPTHHRGSQTCRWAVSLGGLQPSSHDNGASLCHLLTACPACVSIHQQLKKVPSMLTRYVYSWIIMKYLHTFGYQSVFMNCFCSTNFVHHNLHVINSSSICWFFWAAG